MYEIKFIKNYEDLSQDEYRDLIVDFEEKFLNFKKDICSDLSLVDSVLEYSIKYDIDIQILSELIQSSSLLTQVFKMNPTKVPEKQVKSEW